MLGDLPQRLRLRVLDQGADRGGVAGASGRVLGSASTAVRAPRVRREAYGQVLREDVRGAGEGGRGTAGDSSRGKVPPGRIRQLADVARFPAVAPALLRRRGEARWRLVRPRSLLMIAKSIIKLAQFVDSLIDPSRPVHSPFDSEVYQDDLETFQFLSGIIFSISY